MGQRARAILVLSGGMEAVPGIERIRALGVGILVADGDPEAPGFDLADERLVVSTYDVQGCVAAAREATQRWDLAGVLSVAADVPGTVASIAHELGLEGLSREGALLGCDKLAMKRCFAAAGIPVPWFEEVRSVHELEQLVQRESRRLILKPVDSRGARGVLQLNPRCQLDLAWAFSHARRQSPTGRVLVEEFVAGPQFSTESVVLDGEVVTLGLSDRNYEHLERFAPYVIENGGLQPSVHHDEVHAEVDELILNCARAMGLERGTLKGDLVLSSERGLVVIEVAPRLSGGWFATDQIPYSTGVDLVQAAARIALGEVPPLDELRARQRKSVAVRYFFPPPGELVAIEGFDELRREAWVLRAELFVQAPALLSPPTDHTRRAGVVLATGASALEAQERACEAVRRVRFVVRPASGPGPPGVAGASGPTDGAAATGGPGGAWLGNSPQQR